MNKEYKIMARSIFWYAYQNLTKAPHFKGSWTFLILPLTHTILVLLTILVNLKN